MYKSKKGVLMPREGWADRQARITERNVAMWPAWMRREGGNLSIDPKTQEELVGELAAKFQQVPLSQALPEDDARALARAVFEDLCGWAKIEERKK